jgi:hypothetical protein
MRITGAMQQEMAMEAQTLKCLSTLSKTRRLAGYFHTRAYFSHIQKSKALPAAGRQLYLLVMAKPNPDFQKFHHP